MSTIPKTRKQLIEMTTVNFEKLSDELEKGGPRLGSLPCTDDWSVRELLAVRAWWTESVVDWVNQGKKGKSPITPAKGYSWSETPKLNQSIANRAKKESYASVKKRLEKGYSKLMKLIDSMNDKQFLEVGTYEWAGKYPIARWLSLNTTRQYATARTYVRKAIRNVEH
jgi:hypothetical protein